MEAEAEIQRQALRERAKTNAEICAAIASSFLYNFDTNGLQITLKPYMDMSEIQAIEVLNEKNQPFFAYWRDGGIKSGKTIADGVELNTALPTKQGSRFQNEQVGTVILYTTDDLLTKRLEENKDMMKAKVTAFRKETDGKLSKVMLVQSVMVMVVVVILIGAILVSMNFVTVKPIKGIIERFKDMAEGEGDLTARLETKRKDEIGELSGWFNIFIEKIQRIIANVAQNAVHLKNSSKDLAEISEMLTDNARQTSSKAVTVASASEHMSNTISTTAEVMNETANNLNIVASGAEEMTATINEIANNTENARQIAQDAAGQTNSASEKVEELGIAAQQIGKVVETITEISEQVNLLALNATIEAARAGDAGKGFAVVANEIKELANQTATASGEIKQQVEGIQNSTQGTVEKIVSIAEVVAKVNDIVTTISSAVEEQSVTTGDIAGNVARASEGVDDVNKSIAEGSNSAASIATDIAEVTHSSNEITNSSSQVNESSKELSQLAEKLNAMVGQFKV
jgi:methyl-accepting chemotaxis protein